MKSDFTKRGRLIVVDGVSWRYKISQRGSILAYSEDGKRLCEDIGKVKGMHLDDVIEGQWNKSSDGMVKPSHVEKWIKYSGV